MADLAFVAELDASKFHREIDRMDARTRQTESSLMRMDAVINRLLGAGIAFKAAQFGIEAVDAWAKRHDQAAAAIKAHRDQWEGLKADIGSDLIGLVGDTGLIEGTREGRNSTVDFLADVGSGESALNKSLRRGDLGAGGRTVDRMWNATSDFFGFTNESSSAETREAQGAEAAMQKQIARERRLMTERTSMREAMESDIARLSDDPATVERRSHDQRLREIRRGGQDQAGREELTNLENRRHTVAMNRIEEKRQKEERDAREMREVARQSMEFEVERQRIEVDMINAKGVEAHLDRMRLATAEQIARVNRDDLLTEAEKKGYIEEFGATASRREGEMRRKFDADAASQQRYTVLELASVADASTRRQVIGAGPASAERQAATAERTATAAEKTNQLLEKSNDLEDATRQSIDEFIRSGSVARYAR